MYWACFRYRARGRCALRSRRGARGPRRDAHGTRAPPAYAAGAGAYGLALSPLTTAALPAFVKHHVPVITSAISDTLVTPANGVEQAVGKALSLSDRAYVLERGRIVLSGPCEQVKDDKLLRDAYLGL